MKLHFTPTYSSWLNQVELGFAKLQHDVIARGIFPPVSDLARKLRRYINAYFQRRPTVPLELFQTQTPYPSC